MRVTKRMGIGASLALCALLTTAAGTREQAGPVRIVKGDGKTAGVVLYRHGGAAVVRDAIARDADFQDLYAVNTHQFFAPPEFFDAFGETLAFDPGNFAVMRVAPDKIEELSGRMHGLGLACGTVVKLDGSAVDDKVVATPTPLIPVTLRDARVERVVAGVSADNIRAGIAELSAMTTRYHESAPGKGVAEWLAEKYTALAAGRADVTVSTVDHGSSTPQKSIVVRIEGKTRPSEVLILGSHIDSVNWRDGTGARSPGADDNASGTATNLEIFRLLMEEGVELERTLEIHGYAAEEIGLVGSAAIANDYKRRGVNVVAMVQHDMTAWKAAGAPDKIWFVTSNTNAGFNDLLGQLVTGYTGLPFQKAALLGGSSDHASWHRAGFAAAFPFENPSNYNRHIHTANDTLDNATAFTQAAGFAKLGLAYAMHFGGL